MSKLVIGFKVSTTEVEKKTGNKKKKKSIQTHSIKGVAGIWNKLFSKTAD